MSSRVFSVTKYEFLKEYSYVFFNLLWRQGELDLEFLNGLIEYLTFSRYPSSMEETTICEKHAILEKNIIQIEDNLFLAESEQAKYEKTANILNILIRYITKNFSKIYKVQGLLENYMKIQEVLMFYKDYNKYQWQQYKEVNYELNYK